MSRKYRHTEGVETGESSLRDFILDCFGELFEPLRLPDNITDAQIPDEFVPDPYHEQELEMARRKLEKVKGMTLEEAEREAEKEYITARARFNEHIVDPGQTMRNYKSMLEQVEAWRPPSSEDLNGLKEYMLGLLKESIKSKRDRVDYSRPLEKETGEDYKANLVERAQRTVVYHQEQYESGVRIAEGRTARIRALKSSLPER